MNQTEWYRIYTAALLECDLPKLPTRIREAETAIFARIQDLAEDSDSCQERELISDALFSLRTLRKPLLRYSGARPADRSNHSISTLRTPTLSGIARVASSNKPVLPSEGFRVNHKSDGFLEGVFRRQDKL
jgi:hypothetical protein